ncbi:MAG: HPr family phosphocarrier protein [Prevotella sp.]|nr:HPr family phosphocarrier protein [Prevotella sp.]
METQIVFHSLKDIERFTKEVTKFKSECDLSRGNFTVDAKSALAVINCHLDEAYTLKFMSSDDAEVESFKRMLRTF